MNALEGIVTNLETDGLLLIYTNDMKFGSENFEIPEIEIVYKGFILKIIMVSNHSNI